MVRHLQDQGRLVAFDPGATDPKLEIALGDVVSAGVTSRVQDRKDTASFKIDATKRVDDYVGGITSGDRVELYVYLDGDLTTTRYGEGYYGEGFYGGHPSRWTGVAHEPDYTAAGPTKTLMAFESDDFVFGVMDMRHVYDSFENRPIAHDPATDPPQADRGILNEVLEETAPEIDRSGIEPVSKRTDLFSNGRSLMDVAKELHRQADAILASQGTTLVFEPYDGKTPSFTLDPETDVYTYGTSANDDGLKNRWRVDGATNYALDDEQPDHSSTTTVTDTSRATVRVDTRKSEIARVAIWTDADRSAEAGLVVRIQDDDGGAPVDVTNQDSDIVRKQLSADFLSAGDWTTFLMPSHTLNEAQPWLIVESDNSGGQVIGVNATGDPAYQVYYPYPVSVRVEDPGSQELFRRRDGRVKDDALDTFTSARRVGESRLRHNDAPDRELQFEAKSDRCHKLDAGDVVTATLPRVQADGDFVVTKRKDTFEGVTMKTTFSAQDASTL